MKTSLITLFVSFMFIMPVHSSHSKYSMDAFTNPCQSVSLQIQSCQPQNYFNIHESNSKRELSHKYRLSGALVKGKILTVKMVKCHADQKNISKDYKGRDLKDKQFFIHKHSCDKSKKQVQLLVPHQYCDTPGALEIYQCFTHFLSVKYNFIFSNEL